MAPDEPTQRQHRPDELGPRLFQRAGRYAGDLRHWWDPALPADLPDRPTLRNPQAEGWPYRGSTLLFTPENADKAREWSWSYVALYKDARRRAEIGAGRPAMPLDVATKQFLAWRRRDVEYNTYSASRAACGHLRDWLGKGASTDDVTRAELQRLVDDLVQEGYAASSLETLRNHWVAFCKWLNNSDTDGSPARTLRLPSAKREPVQAPDASERARLRLAADQVDFARRHRAPSARLAIELGLTTGLRQMELFAMLRADFDRERESARCWRQMQKDGREIKPYPKSRRARTLWVLPEWWDHYVEGGHALVLCNADGSAIGSQARLSKEIIQRVLDTAGLNRPGRGWHYLRHGYARACLEDYGVTIDELCKFLGHATPSITWTVYGHYAPDRAVDNVRARVRDRERLREHLQAL